jgi:hypothetical protein
MNAFEFVFALYSLILGLSLVELLTGLGRTLEFKLARDAEQRAFRIGWLTPLLAVFVILDLLSFWMFAWLVRDVVAADRFTILGVVVFASAYFLASRLVFPSEPEHFTDLDTHYLRVHRVVFAMLIVMVVVQWLFVATVPALAGQMTSPLSIGLTALLLALMLGAAITRNRKAGVVLLTLLIARYLAIYLV